MRIELKEGEKVHTHIFIMIKKEVEDALCVIKY